MADNTVLNPGSGGDTIRNEDLGASKMPVSKIHTGAANVDGGPVTTSNPLPVGVSFTDAAAVDAFSRLRVSAGVTLFDSMQQYGDDATVWENVVAGTGAVANLLNESTVQMTTGGTANGASVIRQTRQYHRYQPGKSQLVLMTFCMDGGGVVNNRRRIGYFDANNGFFLELVGTTINLVKRSFVSGVAVDTAIPQASWNIDKLNGTGPSGITLDITKVQILLLDLQWLGVGRVRIGFDIDGSVYYAHEFLHANLITSVYTTTACLPIRAENTNTGVTGGTVTMRQICAAVISEGGTERGRFRQFSANNGIAGVAVTTRRPVISIRAKTTGPNAARNTGLIKPGVLDVFATTNNALYEIVLNATTLTGAAFAAFSATSSITEVDTAATAIAGGTVLDSGFVTGSVLGTNARGPMAQESDLLQDLFLAYTSLLNVQETLTLVCTSFAATSTINAAWKWQELF